MGQAGENLRMLTDCMDTLGFNKFEVSEAAGVNVRTVERWLSGDRRVPNAVVKLFELVCMVSAFQADVYIFMTKPED